MLRAAGLEKAGQEAPRRATNKLRERLGQMLDRGQEAYHRIRAVLAKTDHPVSKQGFTQARQLHARLASAMEQVSSARNSSESGKELSESEVLIALLLSTQTVWSSPATRAVQTAQVALQPLCCDSALRIELKSNARERRELTNQITSIGNAYGEQIRQRCLEKLLELNVDDEVLLSRVEGTDLLTSEVEAAWWSDKPESDKDYQARIHELLMQIRYAQHDSLVLVTHDDVFNELFSHNLNATAKAKNSSLADELATGSVPHCAVVWCCCDFRRGDGAFITDFARLDDSLPAATLHADADVLSSVGSGS
uniref:Histidine phosphatase family protein n=2 Tax=Chrysotila carterae TaxID=13221 RepID=A0A7S4F2N0_CHRCT